MPKSKTPKKKDADKAPPVDEKFQTVEVSTSNPRTVLLMLDSPEPVVVCKACEVMHKFIEKSDANCTELNNLGAVCPLVNLLSSPDKAVRSFSVICLASMARNAEVRLILLKKCDCIPPLLALCTPDEELMTQERASFTITHLAGDYTFKVKLLQNSAQDQLVKLALSTDPDVKRNCIKSLSLMAEYYESRPALLEAGALPLVLDCLSSEYAIIQELCLNALHSCAYHSGCRKAIIDSDGLTKIVSFLGQKDWSDLHTLAVCVLGLIMEDADSMAALQGSGLLMQLLTHIRESTVIEVKKQSTKTLAKAATNAINRSILHEQKVEKTFLDLLSSEDPCVIVGACEGLTEMAALSSSRQVMGTEGCVTSLAQCLGREEDEVRAAATRTLATLVCDAPANCKMLEDAGGVELLVGLLQDTVASCRQYAAECVATMAPDEAFRFELANSGAVQALVDCLSFADTRVQSSAMQALGMLSCDCIARQLLLECNGVPPLLTCLQSPSGELVQRTAWTIAIAAQSSQVATAIGQLGGLDLVQRLCSTATGHALIESARMALHKLLSSNLPAKYWISGRLDHTDIIRDTEFFDPGPALSGSTPYTSLSDLLSQSVTCHQPVLTVSLLAKLPPPPEEGSVNLEASQSVGINRTKSRQQGSKKKGKMERGDSRISEISDDPSTVSEKLPGLLGLDTGLWAHIAYTRENLAGLGSVEDQATELAKYVADSFGGALERSGPFGFELPEGQLMREQQSIAVPLGEVKAGGFQHRALLYKVLCDQLGVPCSLVRGEYGRHWNEVLVRGQCDESESVRVCVVDLVFSPGALMEHTSPLAAQYLTI
ncbi:armadillo repeat-containing protein 3-like [Halichondria panicea]|uniref:armadillo repeat-containing protein 3-like n=1 Tax=Halichondria panicea TaxID=6063 RepID=UPI00312B30F8